VSLNQELWDLEFAAHKEFFAAFEEALPYEFLGLHENLQQRDL
jgi:hypothetical protein